MKIDTEVLNFLNSHSVCCLTMLLGDGMPHAATMHYSHNGDTLELYFSTERTGRKFQALKTQDNTGAAVVIGFSEEEWATMQLDGSASEIKDKQELEEIYKIHYAKHPRAEEFKNNPETVFLKFTPTWWRYTKFKPEMIIISSEQK